MPHHSPKAPKQSAGTAGPAGSPIAGVAPGTAPDEYRQNETARYQQMLASLGQGQPGGGLPEGIQQTIERNASLLNK